MVNRIGATPLLALDGIRKSFGATHALRGVSLNVQAGEIHALIGVNGAGKSTLMHILAGAETADAGTVLINGTPFRAANPLEARRAGIAMIYQELSLAGHLSVAENIVLGCEPARCGLLKAKTVAARANEALALMGHSDIDIHAPVHLQGIAQRQVIEIARALSSGCRILVLDEPTSSLSVNDIRKLFDLLKKLQTAGIAIIYISHVLEEIKTISGGYTVLRDGQVAGSGATEKVSTDELITMMSGKSAELLFPRGQRRPGEVLLHCKNVSGHPLPRNVSLELRRGEILGLAGVVGAGRTELMRILMGLDKPAAGTITVAGRHGWKPAGKRLSQGMGLLSEDRKNEGLALKLTLADNMTMSRLSRCGRCGTVQPRRQYNAAVQLIGRLDIRTTGPAQKVQALSGGNQQKVAIGRLLFHDCDILLLDEPTRGVDVHSKQQIYRLIDALATGKNDGKPRAVLLAGSYLPELLGMCDRIAVMHRGRLGQAKPAEQWTEHELLRATAGAQSTVTKTRDNDETTEESS